MDPIVFENIDPIEIPIKLNNKWYALCEASEETVNDFTSAGMSGVELDLTNIDTTSVQTIKDSMQKGIKGFDPSKVKSNKAVLVGGCLKDCTYDEATNKITSVGNSVGVAFAKGLKRSVLATLFTKAKEISELDKVEGVNPFPLSGQKSTSDN